MSDTNEITPDTGVETQVVKKPTSYPFKTLPEAIAFCEKIYKELGDSNYHTNQDIADIHHLAVPTIKQTLSTCQQYLLLENRHGVGYKTTPKLTAILHPETESEKLEMVIECLSNPEIYKDILNEYSGRPLPSETGLTNVLARKGYKVQVAKKIVEIFFENFKHYNLITARNTITLNTKVAVAINGIASKPSETKKEEPSIVADSAKFNKDIEENEEFLDDEYIQIPIPLKSNPALIAKLILPKSFTSEDLSRIAKFVSALE